MLSDLKIAMMSYYDVVNMEVIRKCAMKKGESIRKLGSCTYMISNQYGRDVQLVVAENYGVHEERSMLLFKELDPKRNRIFRVYPVAIFWIVPEEQEDGITAIPGSSYHAFPDDDPNEFLVSAFASGNHIFVDAIATPDDFGSIEKQLNDAKRRAELLSDDSELRESWRQIAESSERLLKNHPQGKEVNPVTRTVILLAVLVFIVLVILAFG